MNYELQIMRKLSRVILLVAVLLLASCSVYDDYDIDLMQDPVASVDSSSSKGESQGNENDGAKSSSSSKTPESTDGSSSSSSVIPSGSEESSSSKKDTTYVVIVNPSSSSEKVEPAVSSSSKTPESAGSSAVENSSSSSSVEPTSSSSEPAIQSSSSVEEFVCGVSKMVRGSIEYETVEILNTCWTAENMKNELSSVETFACYDDDPANCEKYGMMYSYEAASSICPTGWRLPETKDLQDMLDYSGEWNDWAGMYLKSKDGWDGDAETGTDALGFNALPGGGYTNEGFRGLGKYGVWWTSSKKTTTSHYVLKLTGDDDSFYATGNAMENDFYAYVRCIRK
ncbi:MAG: hypothetical protein MJY98_05990 [Fibrobacter sp.]|nr:hypothetical protein [Fibrobacter sp.]